jgi:hypothetical protein
MYETNGAVKVGLFSRTAYYYVIHFTVTLCYVIGSDKTTKCFPLGESRNKSEVIRSL